MSIPSEDPQSDAVTGSAGDPAAPVQPDAAVEVQPEAEVEAAVETVAEVQAEEPEGPREGDRIAKLLARAGIASRREVERMIDEGRVRLNDVVITTPATVLTSLRGITVDGRPVARAEAARLFIFNKPSGLLTAERDPAGRPTIYTALRNALPPGSPRVMPIGRLDLNTEGLLLLTNDGELKRAMELPASGVPRTYRARTFGDISQPRLEELIDGIEIEGVRYGAIDANMERRTGRNQWIELTLKEGKNREVRRVLEHLGLQVSRLIRVRYGPFELGEMPRGAVGEIAPAQVERYRREIGLPPSEAGAERPAARLATRKAQVPAGAAPIRARGPVPGQPQVRPPRRKPDPARPDERAGARTAPWASPAHDPENIERRERNARADQAERAERTERRARREAPAGGAATARPADRGERAARPPERGDRAARPPERSDRAARPARPVASERRFETRAAPRTDSRPDTRPDTRPERREGAPARPDRSRDDRPRRGAERPRGGPERTDGERAGTERNTLSRTAPGRSGPGKSSSRPAPSRNGPDRGPPRSGPGPKRGGPRK